ncbi:unnamed protein product [Spirodela intermedia]|uniref:HIG1 domain-containing protein n=2 Tax=Spirodela intermedia TaxID=51605 RepID=A0A7I8JG38_SPIIN|nr:unnamed protein product [Spirodela intermedia]CAA6669106.1 unnamed protein product [Spirodela intermedia]CAA7406055.1 unnamed protein product [Spirodela intermedia]
MSENQAAATTTTAAASTAMESARKWVVENKLKTVGCLWLSGVTGSFAYNWSQPAMKTSVKIIHARLHAQALTLAALAGAAVVEYYDRQHGSKVQQRQGERLFAAPPTHEN